MDANALKVRDVQKQGKTALKPSRRGDNDLVSPKGNCGLTGNLDIAHGIFEGVAIEDVIDEKLPKGAVLDGRLTDEAQFHDRPFAQIGGRPATG